MLKHLGFHPFGKWSTYTSIQIPAHRFQGHGNLTGRALHETGLRIFWVDHQASKRRRWVQRVTKRRPKLGTRNGAGAGVGWVDVLQMVISIEFDRLTHIFPWDEWWMMKDGKFGVESDESWTMTESMPLVFGKMIKNEGLANKHTVDGGNPAPVGRWFIPWLSHYLQCFIVPNSYQLVQDFLHPQYVVMHNLHHRIKEHPKYSCMTPTKTVYHVQKLEVQQINERSRRNNEFKR